MRKKLITRLFLLTACISLAFGFASCGGGGSSAPESSPNSAESSAPEGSSSQTESSAPEGSSSQTESSAPEGSENGATDKEEEKAPTEGLAYDLSGDETYYILSGIGTATKTEIVIPAEHNNLPVRKIGYRAFSNCDSLTSIEIPEGVTTIGAEAFLGCDNLTGVEIPDSVTTIGSYVWFAFSNCTSLTSITVGENNQNYKSIDGNLYNKDGTTLIQYAIGKTEEKFIIPEGVTTIGTWVFQNCTSLKSVEIPDSVTMIVANAFLSCTSLISIEIPDSVTTIGDYAFSNCTSLTSITVGENNQNYKSIDGNLYNKDGTTLMQYAIGKTEEEFIIPEGVTTIGTFAFQNCTSLKSVEIPDSVTTIEYSAFIAFTSLTSIEIPDSVTEIGGMAFYACISLTNITVGKNNQNYKSIDGNLYNKDGTKLIQYAIGKTEEEFIIPEGVTTIEYSAFYYCTSLTSIEIPNGVTTIESSAFMSCTSLTSIEIPNGVTTIEMWAFYGCESLTSIEIPDGVTTIESKAFYNCNNLTSVVIPDSVTAIGEYAFDGCTSLTSVYYGGTETEWNAISVENYNEALTSAKRYYYSETEPTTAGNYWHYDTDGKTPVVW